MHRLLLTLVMSIISTHSFAADAERLQAAATVRTWTFAARGIAAKCSAAFPDLAKQVQGDLAVWERKDRVAIQRAETLWKSMQAQSPRSAQEEQADKEQLEQLWRAISEQRPGEAPTQARARCTQYFSDRANGALRQRRPEVFQALEAP